MPVLVIDTSAEIVVGLLADAVAPSPAGDPPSPPAVLAERRVGEQRRHAELLAPMVAEVLAATRTRPADLTSVVVGTGPAPFTGLRAGLVTARTLALTLEVPVHGVCSLDALAVQALRARAGRPPVPGGPPEVLVVTDARRREVYHAQYRAGSDVRVGDVDRVAGPGVEHPDRLAAVASRAGVEVVGPGADLYPEHLAATADAPRRIDPAVLGMLGLLRAGRGEDQPTAPLYLRRPDVAPSAARKRVTG